jgi:TrmH family RNA methyltransferase
MAVIASRHNPLVARCRRLGRGRSPDDRGWLLEGWRLVADALAAGVRLEVIAVPTGVPVAPGHDALVRQAQAHGARLASVTPMVLDAMSPVREPSGVVAIARPRAWQLTDCLRPAPAFIVVACDVQDPGNVGAIVRAADAASATGVIAGGSTADPGSWKALRGAMGSAFRLPVVAAPDLLETLAALEAHGIVVLATTARDGRAVHDADLRRPVACLLGAEGPGLDASLAAAAHETISIPMRAGVESLNVATAAAVIAYEAWRQRRADHPRS